MTLNRFPHINKVSVAGTEEGSRIEHFQDHGPEHEISPHIAQRRPFHLDV